ncbi:hypothetical protein ACRYCC_07825 [Actinomadura scrupuli]|uniref:hypothetical protein n=1 Tax=Actinomadura scrupuli TaxID=559629 RepID=UPI003D95AC58
MGLIAKVLRRQSEQDRRTILAVVAGMAAQQQPGTREFLEDFPRLAGLIGSDDG